MKNIILKNNKMSIVYHKLNALDLWDVQTTIPHPANNMNLKFKNIGSKIPGFGVYSISYDDDNFGNRIIYLGKFAGEKSKNLEIDNATSGDVRDRWYKHIGTATLLLTNLTMSSDNKFYTHKRRSDIFYKNNKQFKTAFEMSFLNLDNKKLKEFVFLKGKDLQVSGNRLGFAIQNLTWTNKSYPNTAEELRNVISRFTCHYWQVIPASLTKKSTINDSLVGQRGQKGVESEIIKKYKQKLPMNKEYKPPKELKNYYHYDPENLIEVSNELGSEFIEYSNYIKEQLENTLSLA
jgi:hypothetical protein